MAPISSTGSFTARKRVMVFQLKPASLSFSCAITMIGQTQDFISQRSLHLISPTCRIDQSLGLAIGVYKMKRTGICILLALLSLTAAWPQASTSTIRGTVRDQGQAVAPKATITLTNTATNVARTTESNEAGGYVFPNSIPGPYRL